MTPRAERVCDRLAKWLLLAPFAVGMFIHGATKPVRFPPTEAGVQYLVDRGSYVTNDFVHLDWTRRIVPDDAALVVERRPVASTNAADWASFLETTFAAFSVPTNLPCAGATNWAWQVFADWTPPPAVQTNGVLHALWGVSLRDAAFRAAGLAVGVPAQSTAWGDGALLGTPGGTNGLAGAAADALADESEGEGADE